MASKQALTAAMCLKHAMEARAEAAREKDPKVRTQMEEIAAEWERLATTVGLPQVH